MYRGVLTNLTNPVHWSYTLLLMLISDPYAVNNKFKQNKKYVDSNKLTCSNREVILENGN